MLSIVAWNVLAPSLANSSDMPWSKRARKICEFSLAHKPNIVSFSEVDEYVDDKYFVDYFNFKDGFPFDDYFYAYLPKAASVDARNIKVRHGNLLIIKKRDFEIISTFMLPMGEAQWENQVANCVLLRHRRCNDVSFAVVSVHLKSGTSDDARNMRKSQLAKLQYFVSRLPTAFRNRVLLMGDFNQDALELADYVSVYSSCKPSGLDQVPCDRTQANVAIASENKKDSKLNNERLDYVFFSRGEFRVDRLFVWQGSTIADFEQRNLSDHFPIMCHIMPMSCPTANPFDVDA